MPHYAITVAPNEADQELKVTLRGPGLNRNGRGYVFRNTYRCATFIEAVNFAYEQGLRDGARRARNREDELLLVTGATPETVAIRREGRWSRWKRRWLQP